jgi:hypothetical protein
MLYFDETVFHFASLHPNAGAQLKAEILLLHPTLRNAQGEGCVDAPNMSNSANSAPESYAETCTHHGSSNNVENEEAEMPTDPVAADNLGARSSVDATPDAATESSSGADGAGIGSSLGSTPTWSYILCAADLATTNHRWGFWCCRNRRSGSVHWHA